MTPSERAELDALKAKRRAEDPELQALYTQRSAIVETARVLRRLRGQVGAPPPPPPCRPTQDRAKLAKLSYQELEKLDRASMREVRAVGAEVNRGLRQLSRRLLRPSPPSRIRRRARAPRRCPRRVGGRVTRAGPIAGDDGPASCNTLSRRGQRPRSLTTTGVPPRGGSRRPEAPARDLDGPLSARGPS